jgi:hypothetical protein
VIHQLRIYKIFEQNKAAFHTRFRDHTARLMRGYGFNIVAMWESCSEGLATCLLHERRSTMLPVRSCARQGCTWAVHHGANALRVCCELQFVIARI